MAGVLSIYLVLTLYQLLKDVDRFLPRILGVFLVVAGGAYLVSTVTYFFFPASYRLVLYVVTAPAAALGEIGFAGWLLIKGVRTERLEAS